MRASSPSVLRKGAYRLYPGRKSGGAEQTGKDCGGVCKKTADPGAADGTDRGRADGTHAAERSHRHDRGGAYVYDNARSEKARQQNSKLCMQRMF